MEPQTLYALIADIVLIGHVMFAAFVVFGLILIFVGKFRSWQWVRNPWFRVAHLAGIGVVVLQSWFGAICPLTIWEMELRSKAGGSVYEGSFIAHWLTELLYFQAPPWVFMVCYTLFGVLVLSSWFVVRPNAFSAEIRNDAS
jgi:hypothetical protein